MKEIISTDLCDHCKISMARYISRAGKLCCENNVAKCPEIKAKIGIKNSDILSKVDEVTGLTKAQTLAKSKKDTAELNGYTDPYKIAAQKMVSKRKLEDSFKSAAIKSIKTKSVIGADGKTIFERSTEKMVKTRAAINPDTNLSSFQTAANKSANTRLGDIDDKGRNGFDRMWIKAGQSKQLLDTNIYYRSRYEKDFLDSLIEKFGKEWVISNVKNPTSIPYDVDGRKRKYIPDFVIGNTLYEIKSSYTWDNFGKNEQWRTTNIAKLNAASCKGYSVILVLDGIQHNWKEYRKIYELLG